MINNELQKWQVRNYAAVGIGGGICAAVGELRFSNRSMDVNQGFDAANQSGGVTGFDLPTPEQSVSIFARDNCSCTGASSL